MCGVQRQVNHIVVMSRKGRKVEKKGYTRIIKKKN